jgi:hypothetical protein
LKPTARQLFKKDFSLKLDAGFDTPDARFVDHRSQVVEVDAGNGAFVIGDVPDKAGDVIAVSLVAECADRPPSACHR